MKHVMRRVAAQPRQERERILDVLQDVQRQDHVVDSNRAGGGQDLHLLVPEPGGVIWCRGFHPEESEQLKQMILEHVAQYAGLTATEGFIYYLGFLALVSISLGVLNLLPVPVLDGGQILFQLVEMAKGAPLSAEAQVIGQKLGIAMLVALMGFAFYNDITRLFG